MQGTDQPFVSLIGFGASVDTLTREAAEALYASSLLIGAKRLLHAVRDDGNARREALTDAEEICRVISEAPEKAICVLYSGDTGFYSGAAQLIPRLQAREIPFRVFPGLSSIQMLAARVGEPWQDWTLCSAHGKSCDPVAALMRGGAVCFLTGSRQTPDALCREITGAGLGFLRVRVGENLFCEDERITEMTAAQCAEKTFAPLSVLLTDAAPVPYAGVSGFADADFIRGDVPMTKAAVRAAICASLRLRPADTVWDVGAGTGSVSVALSALCVQGRVFAVEYRDEALSLIRKNRGKFSMWNLRVVSGRAPEALSALPAPDKVFIGGTAGKLENILDAALSANGGARICMTAIALETLEAARALLQARGLSPEVSLISESHTRKAGALHLLCANNPVFLITAGGGEA